MSWLQKPIFVTGATGFIGGRICERLVLAGATQVRALVHTVQHAPRIARLPIRFARVICLIANHFVKLWATRGS